MLAHDHRRAEIEPFLPVPDRSPDARDVAIAGRLIAAYRAAKAAERALAPAGPDVWTEIRALQSTYLATLESGDAPALAAYLCNMYRTDATHGTAQGVHDHRRLQADPAYRRVAALMVKDKLLSFAEALGVIDLENPEPGEPGEAFRRPAQTLLAALSERTGTDLTPPDIDGGLFKLRAGAARLHERDLHGQFIAFSLLRGAGPPAAICEIGGGVGRLAYWAHRFGAARYAMLDLPHINVLQGYYLLRALPEADVELFGETAAAPHFRILPYFAKQALDGEGIELVVNVDSFPEIEAAKVQDYLRWIGALGATFVSINHERRLASHSGAVRDMAAATGGFERIAREPYWLRRGYVREVYRTR